MNRLKNLFCIWRSYRNYRKAYLFFKDGAHYYKKANAWDDKVDPKWGRE